MGLRSRKSLKLAPGLRLNLGKRAPGLSIDGKGLTLNVGKKRVRNTGRGVSYLRHTAYRTMGRVRQQNNGSHNPLLAIGLVLLAVLSVVVMAMHGR
jgi:hypothetical protein